MQIRALLSALIASIAVACGSMPKASLIAANPQLPVNLSNRIVHLPKCDDRIPEGALRYCNVRTTDLYNALISSEIFKEVVIGEQPEGDGVYVIDIYDFQRRPYWSTPAHNPGLLLLSLAIPFWWEEPLGFYFGIREFPNGTSVEIDTRWRGTSVMWSLAAFLNVLPNRTFRSTFDQDISRLREALQSQ